MQRHVVFEISIHAPREGGDYDKARERHCEEDFNPRPPRGGRLIRQSHLPADLHFNPRPPRGGRRRFWHKPTG